MELDGGGSNLDVALGGGLQDSGTRWRGIKPRSGTGRRLTRQWN